MKSKKKSLVFSIFVLLILISLNGRVLANTEVKPVEYSEEFKRYISLSEEEKKGLIQPRMYDVLDVNTRESNIFSMVGKSGAISPSYTLKNIISENMVVKDQKSTSSCWDFASLAALETHLALRDYYNGRSAKVYDFSERHMEYTTARNFANEAINQKGFNRNVGDGGTYFFAETYLTNGYGAINEEDMPFEDNDNLIELSSIDNKTVRTKVYDTVWFPTATPDTVTIEEMNSIKEHIRTNGAVFTGICGTADQFYNNDTGALCCDNSTGNYGINHMVAIVGWDDDYSIDNFNEGAKPSRKGAWLAKNSWGVESELTLEEMKTEIFKTFHDECIAEGWHSAAEIPDEVALGLFGQNGYEIRDNKAYKTIGDNGFYHISYDDDNVYLVLWGIEKATTDFEKSNIYMYNEFGASKQIECGNSTVYLGNVFSKKNSGKEYLTEVSFISAETSDCSVYVNPTGSSMAKNKLQQVALKSGNTKTVGPGYHTLEFEEPLEITGNSFSVVIKIQGRRGTTGIYLESNTPDVDVYNVVHVERGKCFYADAQSFETNTWEDFADLNTKGYNLLPGDSTVRAFTVNNVSDNSLNRIEITTEPEKKVYFVGDNFDKTGMVVTAYYNNGEERVIEDYDIKNGSSLSKGQTYITVEYEGKTVNQGITVEENSVTELIIATPPETTVYKAGHDFNREGMVVKAKYKNGDIEEITNYSIPDGLDLKNGQTYVTISYMGKTITQEITVEENRVIGIEITKAPNKTNYVVGQEFNPEGMVVKATYEDGTVKEIKSYTVTNGSSLRLDQTEVIISFEGQEASQSITVEEKNIVSIEVSKMPTKTKYIQNKEQLDLTGGKIKVIYNDETFEEVPMDSNKVEASGFNNENIGKNTITLTYENKTTTFTVDIIEEPTAVNSNFSNAEAKIDGMKIYTYTDDEKVDYQIIEMTIKNIDKDNENDDYEYYYYLSENKSDKNITDWIKISEKQESDDKLVFVIDTRDVDNYLDLLEADEVYLYIKEVAIRGGNQKTAVYGGFHVDNYDDAEVYVDDVKQDKKASTPEEDPTIANKTIPNTGKLFKSLFIIIGIVLSIVFFIKYRKYKEI